MSTFASVFTVPEREASPAAAFTPAGRIAAASTLVLGAACQLVAFLAIPTLLFIPGVLLGLLTMTVALWRSRAVPRGAVALIPVFMVTDVFLQLGDLAHAIALVGASWIAWAIVTARDAAPEGARAGAS